MTMFRRCLLGLMLLVPAIGFGHAARAAGQKVVPVAGLVPPLAFTLTDARTGKTVTAASFRGKVVMVFFGYTNCTDECPDTLIKLHRLFQRLGPAAKQVVLLFVTVDPARDTLKVLDSYLPAFDPRFIGLRGTANQVYRLTRRYRVVASVHPSPDPAHYEVVHSALTYVFGPHGNARFIIPDLALTPHPDYRALAAHVKQVLTDRRPGLLLRWFADLG